MIGKGRGAAVATIRSALVKFAVRAEELKRAIKAPAAFPRHLRLALALVTQRLTEAARLPPMGLMSSDFDE